MAAATFDLNLWPWGFSNGNFTFNSLVIDAATKKVGWVAQMPAADTITTLLFRYGARAATPVQHKISLQGVDGSGLPDGTILGGGTPASGTFTPPASTAWNGLVQAVTLDNSLAMTRGQLFSVVIEPVGTPDVTNSSSFTYTINEFVEASRNGFPYALTYSSGWTKQNNSMPIFGLRSATATYGDPIQAQGDTTTTVSNTRAAVHVNLASGYGTSYQIVGLKLNSAAPGGTWKMGLWDASGAVLQDISLDGDVSAAAGSGFRPHRFYFDEATLATLSFGTDYYLGMERNPTDSTVYGITVAAAGDLGAFPGGSGFYLAVWNGSAWVTTTTTRPMIEPIFADWTASAGGATPFPVSVFDVAQVGFGAVGY